MGVNMGVIGVGAFMSRQHLPNMKRIPGTRIHTLCDLDRDLLAERAAEYDPVRTTTDGDSVFADPEVDAVLVGTRSAEHARFISMAAAHGKAVYVENP